MSNSVAIIDFRNIISTGHYEVIARHDKYASELKEQDPFASLLVFSRFKTNVQPDPLSNLKIFETKSSWWNIFLYSWRVSKQICVEKSEVSLLVAGDPWESLIASILVRFFGKLSVPIQTQIHADIGDKNWEQLNFRNRIRKQLAKFTLHFASQIRATSQSQKNQLVERYGIALEKIVVIPVPLNFSSTSVTSGNSTRPRSIAFVGRIQKDRGLDDFIDVLTKLIVEIEDLVVIVAGDGPSALDFKIRILEHIPSSQLIWSGFLNPQQLSETWGKVGVLVSCAPAESYGRAIREALAHGVPVLALSSSGVKDAILDYGGKFVKIFSKDSTGHELSLLLDELFETEIPQTIILEVLTTDDQLSKRIAQGWINLVQSNQRSSN